MARISFLVTALLSFALSALSGFIFIPWLRKLKFGQTILEIGPNWHRAKQGTPTMGGFMFYAGTFVGICGGLFMISGELKNLIGAMYTNQGVSLCVSVLTALGFGIIGYVDDHM